MSQPSQDIAAEVRLRTSLDRGTPGFRFQWPRRGGRSVLEVVRDALTAMTAGRCSYCDGHPIDATGAETVDHFRPKGRPEFYELVCTWTNLFLTCTACNHAKAEQWDEALLRPDDVGFSFDRRAHGVVRAPWGPTPQRRRRP